jgi:type I restriction enzyme, S subunit
MNNWPTKHLEALTKLDRPITYGVVKPGPTDDSGVLFIRGGDIAEGRILTNQLRTISHEVSNQYRRTLLAGGELIVSLVGNPGQVSIVPMELKGANIARQVALVSLRDDVDARFIKFYLMSRHGKNALKGQSIGSVQQVINLRDLKKIPLPLPSLNEQRAIAHVLGTFDDKIELNRKMNETLEELASAIFKSWFVDFDPVKAKSEGRQPVGMDAETAALFPDSFEDSELGFIPKGWNASSIENEFNITMGQSPPGSSYNEVGDGIPFFQGRRDFGTRFPSVRVYCTDPRRFANDNDTLLSVRAPVGDINIADRKCCIGRGLASIRHKSGAVSYTFGVARQLQHKLRVFEGEGTVFGSINRKELGSLSLCEPPKSVLDKFDSTYHSLDDLIRQNTEESSTLIELRDTLLPRLISGKLRISDTEKLLAEAPV